MEILLQHKEVILKKIDDNSTMFEEPDSLVRAEILQVGESCEKYKEWVGKEVLCRKDILKDVKHDLFKNKKIIYNEDLIFGKCLNS